VNDHKEDGDFAVTDPARLAVKIRWSHLKTEIVELCKRPIFADSRLASLTILVIT
jgi:hypothetical protein